MSIVLSPKWKATDKGIDFVFNFTDVREKVEVFSGNDLIENMTYTNKSRTSLLTGDNIIYNDTETR